MIEILFGESEAASMKVAKNNPPLRESAGRLKGTSNEVICLGFMLDIGEINQDICGEYRKKLIYSMLNQGQWGYDAEMDNGLMEMGKRK